MADSIILFEEREEVATFLLDEGTITATTVTTILLAIFNLKAKSSKYFV